MRGLATFSAQIPSIDTFAGNYPRVNKSYNKHQQKVEAFFAGEDFQVFCRFSEIPVKSGMVMQVSISRENPDYVLDGGWVISGLTINLLDKDGARYYKSEKVITPATKICEKRIFYSASYLVTEKDGVWKAECLLKDDGYLDGKKVDAAFDAYCARHRYSGDEKAEMVDVALHVDGKSPFSTKAWYRNVVTARGTKRRLLCLMDNGKILDVEKGASGFEPVSVRPLSYLKTKFNWFQYIGSRVYTRFK